MYRERFFGGAEPSLDDVDALKRVPSTRRSRPANGARRPIARPPRDGRLGAALRLPRQAHTGCALPARQRRRELSAAHSPGRRWSCSWSCSTAGSSLRAAMSCGVVGLLCSPGYSRVQEFDLWHEPARFLARSSSGREKGSSTAS